MSGTRTWVQHQILCIFLPLKQPMSLSWWISFLVMFPSHWYWFMLSITHFLKSLLSSSHCGSAVMNPKTVHEVAGSIPDLAPGLRVLFWHELHWRLQMWLRAHISVAVTYASNYSSSLYSSPSLGTSIYLRCGPKKTKEKKACLNTVLFMVPLNILVYQNTGIRSL